MIEVLPGEEHAFTDVMSGEYEKYYKIKRGDFVLDLGANVGFFTERSANFVRDGGVVMSFEPDWNNFVRLRERTMKYPNVVAYNKAAGNKNELSVLWNHPGNNGAHSLFKSEQHDTSSPVEVVDIQEYLVRHPDFIKIDTEGSEADIVQSLMKSPLKIRCPMAIECHSVELFERCRELLSGRYDLEHQLNSVVGVCHAIPK